MILRCCVVSFRLALLLLVGVVEASAQKPPPAKPFERFDGFLGSLLILGVRFVLGSCALHLSSPSEHRLNALSAEGRERIRCGQQRSSAKPRVVSAFRGSFTQHKAERNWNFGSAVPSDNSESCACPCPLFVLPYARGKADRTGFY